ncbi:MAG TPA: dihydroneopterin aldolase [Massilibacterium sp.]|nr:dihydroneopterin aldolase [Massilibacterium sp.]
MDKIYINQMQFYAYHGVFPEENRLGQTFIVDVVLELDLKKAGESDDVRDTVDYGLVYEKIKKIVEEETYQLIERLAEKISFELLRTFSALFACTIRVIKPNAPIPGHLDSVAVEVTRKRTDYE